MDISISLIHMPLSTMTPIGMPMTTTQLTTLSSITTTMEEITQMTIMTPITTRSLTM